MPVNVPQNKAHKAKFGNLDHSLSLSLSDILAQVIGSHYSVCGTADRMCVDVCISSVCEIH